MDRILDVLSKVERLVAVLEFGGDAAADVIDRAMTLIQRAVRERRDLTPAEFREFSGKIDDMRSRLHSD